MTLRTVCPASGVQLRAFIGIPELLEKFQHVATKIVLLLVYFPAHPRFFEAFRIGCPTVTAIRHFVVCAWTAMPAIRINSSRHEIHPVRVCRPHERAMIGVANRE